MSAEICSFYGADGSGKSTVARRFVEEMNSRGHEYHMLGGSTYKEWLTPRIAKEVIGKDHHIGEVTETPGEYVRLCEEIAIACYGLAQRLREDGKGVAIDSDPWLKRIIWEEVTETDQSKLDNYKERFEGAMQDKLGYEVGPSVVVGVNMHDTASSDDLLGRIQARENNSEHDPTEIEEMLHLVRVVSKVWFGVEQAIDAGSSAYPGFNTRLRGARKLLVSNPSCEPSQLAVQSRAIGASIADDILSR